MSQKLIPGNQIDAGTGADQVVQLDGTGKLPAVDGTQLVGVVSGVPTGWETQDGSYDSITFDYTTEVTGDSAESIVFSDNGIEMVLQWQDDIYHYTLGTAWDITTAVFSESKTAIAEASSFGGMVFNPAGTKMYLIELLNQKIHQYTLSGAWDVSTATYDSVSYLFGSGNSRGLFFAPDGLRCYTIDENSDLINQLKLATAWDIGTASYAAQYLDTTVEMTDPSGISFSPDGRRLFVMSYFHDAIRTYILSTPWEITTATPSSSTTLSVAGETTSPSGLFVKTDGSKAYVTSSDTNGLIYQYDVRGESVYRPASTMERGISLVSTQAEVDAGIVADTIVTPATLNEWGTPTTDLPTTNWSPEGWQLSGATLDISLNMREAGNIGSLDANDLCWSDDGMNVYILHTGTLVYQYALGTAWDIETIIDVKSYAPTAITTATGIFMQPGGARMWILEQNSDQVHEFDLGTNYDVSTSSPSGSIHTIAGLSLGTALTFKPDGTTFWTAENTGDWIKEFNCTTPWSVAAVTDPSNAFATTAVESAPTGISFSADGVTMLIVGSSSDEINSFTLSTPWDVSTAVDNATPVDLGAIGATNPYGIFAKTDDGTKVWVTNLSGMMHQYDTRGTTSIDMTLGELSDVVIGGSPLLTDDVLTYDGTNWINKPSAGGGLAAVVDDTSPQLGGNLNVAAFDIITSDSATTTLPIDIIGGSHTGAVADTDGGQINITGGASNGTGALANGGHILINAGAATGAGSFGGAAYMYGGASAHRGGNAHLKGGIGGDDTSGQAAIIGGPSSTNEPGRALVLGGVSTNASYSGGNADIQAGNSPSGGTGGDVNISPGGGSATSGSINIHSAFQQIGQGAIQFWDDTNISHTLGNYVELKAPAFAGSPTPANVTYVLPEFDGTNGQVLSTDGSGNLSFVTASGGGAFTNDGSNNLLGGTNAGDSLTSGYGSFFAGLNAGTACTTGIGNVAIGHEAFKASVNGTGSVVIGYKAMIANVGQFNVVVGQYALDRATSGNDNVIIGRISGRNLVSSDNNIVIGSGAMSGQPASSTSLADHNVVIGHEALRNAVDGGAYNVTVGSYSGNDISTGSNNTCMGYKSGNTITTGSYNTCIGNLAGPQTGVTVSNKLYINNAASDTPLIGGDFSANTVNITGTLSVSGSTTVPGLFVSTTGEVDNPYIYESADGVLSVRLGQAAAYKYITMAADGNISAVSATAPADDSHLVRRDYVTDTTVALDGTRTMTGNLTVESGAGSRVLVTPTTNTGAFPGFVITDDASGIRSVFEWKPDGTTTIQNRDASNNKLTLLSLGTDGNVSQTTDGSTATTPTADTHLVHKGYTDQIAKSRNVIINGNFDVWQRGTNFAAITSGNYSADRFAYGTVGAMVHTIARSADVPTYAQSGVKSNYSFLMDCTTADASIAAGDYSLLSYRIEGYDYARVAGGDATLSFWVKGAKTGIHCVAFRNNGADRSYVTEYTIAAADTWEKHTVTVPLNITAGTWNYTTGKGLHIDFILAAGTTFHTTKDAWQTGNLLATSSQVNEVDNTANNFRIAQVQFEKGSQATPLEYKNYDDEFAKCKRYFEKSYSQGTNPGTSTVIGSMYYPPTRNNATLETGFRYDTTKRSVPTIALYSSATGTVARVDNNGTDRVASALDIGDSGIRYVSIISGTTAALTYHWTADAEL